MARTCRTRPQPIRDLEALAHKLDAIAEDVGWGAPPMLIGLTDDGVDEIAPPAPVPGSGGTDPDDLVATLVGFDAPADWQAMAVIVQGRAFALDDPAADPRPVRLVHVVDRDGTAASVIRRPGEDPLPSGAGGDGRMVDVCRRVMGLATAPPPDDSTGAWAVLWLDTLLARAAEGEVVADLAAAARLHPAIELFAAHEPSMASAAASRLERLGQIMGSARPWSDLRAATAAGEWAVEGLGAEGAAWMDDGMFARWVLGGFPTPDEYLPELERLLPEGVVSGVRGVLEAWDLLEVSRPTGTR